MIPIHCKEALMKLSILVAALIASVALAVPADAASKKRKKVAHRAPISAVQAGYGSAGVYVGGELVGRDPDPGIRSYMMRDPKPWEGND
jgi:hypothetical protein